MLWTEWKLPNTISRIGSLFQFIGWFLVKIEADALRTQGIKKQRVTSWKWMRWGQSGDGMTECRNLTGTQRCWKVSCSAQKVGSYSGHSHDVPIYNSAPNTRRRTEGTEVWSDLFNYHELIKGFCPAVLALRHTAHTQTTQNSTVTSNHSKRK